MKTKQIFPGLAALLLVWLTVSALPGAADAGQKGQSGLTVVELYTSQGCSSCPPADFLLGQLARQSGILALSFHVDYWDYIGWKDPYGSADNTRRQRDYKKTFNRSYVYTPQMVVGGMFEVTSSDIAAVKDGIRQAGLAPNVPIGLVRDDSGDLNISVSGSARPAQLAIWLALFELTTETRVRRGENRGRTIINHNVVRTFKKIGDWTGAPKTLTVAAAELKQHKGRGCAVFLQSELKGPILGAAAIILEPQR
jgi:hypothetical protein